jgi:hypothetical protein
MYDSYYTIQVLHKGQLEWYSLDGWLPCNKETKATTLALAEDLIAKIDYDCKVRIIHVTKNIIETREINNSTPLSNQALLDLIADMPILATAGGGICQVTKIEKHKGAFITCNMQTGVLTTYMFDNAAILEDKLQVFTVNGSKYLFTVYKPFTVHKPVKLN